jgi:hypothetical protein
MAGKIAYKASHRRVEWANNTTVNPWQFGNNPKLL